MSVSSPDPLKPLHEATVGAGEISAEDFAEAVHVLTVLNEQVTGPAVLAQLILLGKLDGGRRERVEARLENRDAGAVRRLGRYRMLNKIGQGEFGVVYEAEETSSGLHYAVKILPRQFRSDPRFVERFKKEARIAQALKHPNIVHCHEAGELDGFLYYTMEHLQGQTLQQSLEHGPLKPLVALRYMVDIADALDHAHRVGIVHRDVKPENLFVTDDGVVKILDMGLSKDVRGEQESDATSHAAVGTPDYMSPEQTRGATDIDGRADIYSLGATFYHLITGRVPYTGDTAHEVMVKHNREPVPDPAAIDPKLPPDLCIVVRKMMEKSPDDRYRNAAQLLEDLIACENARRAAKRLSKSRQQKKVVRNNAAGEPVPADLDDDETFLAPPRHPWLTWCCLVLFTALVTVLVLDLTEAIPELNHALDPYLDPAVQPLVHRIMPYVRNE